MKKQTSLCVLCMYSMTILCLSGCFTGSYSMIRTSNKGAALSNLETMAAGYEGVDRNPLIVIHGIFGSRLVNYETGSVVWGTFSGSDTIKSMAFGESPELQLPMRHGVALEALNDDIRPHGILDTVKVRLLALPLQVSAYHDLMDLLATGGYFAENHRNPYNKDYHTAFQFAYDWRRDIPWNARKLHEFIQEKKLYIQQQYAMHHGVEDYDVQFDIVAHSMGGLLSRYYMRYGDADLPADGSLPEITWAGSKSIDKVMIIGAPNGGYVDTFLELLNGLVFAPGAPKIEPAILGTFPTYYQMLPLVGGLVRGDDPCNKLDVFDPALWIKYKWGLLDPAQDRVLQKILPDIQSKEERRAIAIDHLTKCLTRARQFTDAMSVEASPPNDVSFHLFMGSAILTNAVVSINEKSGVARVITKEPGDGKVTAVSAVYDRRYCGEFTPYINTPIDWKSASVLFSGHMGITRSPVFASNIWYVLHAKRD